LEREARPLPNLKRLPSLFDALDWAAPKFLFRLIA